VLCRGAGEVALKACTTEGTEKTEKRDRIYVIEKQRLNGITEAINGGAIQVHRVLGPGLLESAYEACLAFELKKRGLCVEQQWPLPLVYE
jgi:hypothetical protein